MLVVNTFIHLINSRNLEHIKIAKFSFQTRRKPENTQSWILCLRRWHLTRTSLNSLYFKPPPPPPKKKKNHYNSHYSSPPVLVLSHVKFPHNNTYFLKTNFNTTFSFTPSYPREVSRLKFSVNFSLPLYVLRVQTCSFLTC
jgi:hypothetical protein